VKIFLLSLFSCLVAAVIRGVAACSKIITTGAVRADAELSVRSEASGKEACGTP